MGGLEDEREKEGGEGEEEEEGRVRWLSHRWLKGFRLSRGKPGVKWCGAGSRSRGRQQLVREKAGVGCASEGGGKGGEGGVGERWLAVYSLFCYA